MTQQIRKSDNLIVVQTTVDLFADWHLPKLLSHAFSSEVAFGCPGDWLRFPAVIKLQATRQFGCNSNVFRQWHLVHRVESTV